MSDPEYWKRKTQVANARIRELEAEVKFKKAVITEQTGNINRLQAEVDRLREANRDALERLQRSADICQRNIDLRRLLEAIIRHRYDSDYQTMVRALDEAEKHIADEAPEA